MKKYFLVILFVGFLSITYAQETNNSWDVADNMVKPGETKIITQDLAVDNINALKYIQSKFCNDEEFTRDLKISMRPGQRKEICVAFANQSDKPISIIYWFSEWILTKEWAPMCQADMSKENAFSENILRNNKTTGATIPGSGILIQKFTYVVPKNVSWDILGCFGYKATDPGQIKEGNMFLIVPRRVGYIWINITWGVYNFWRRDETKNIYTSNKSSILKVVAGILGIWIIISIIQATKKKEKHTKEKHHKKK